MSLVNIFFIAVGLAMDAFAVSIANGISLKRYKPTFSLIFGFYFGLFQFMMPLIGFYVGSSFSRFISDYDHWIAFGLLSLIGGKMIWETFRNESQDDPNAPKSDHLEDERRILSPKNMVMLAIATSIDALAVGVSFALMKVNILLCASVIGVVAFVLPAIGIWAGFSIGKRLGSMFQSLSGRFGGIVLIIIGVKILLEHFIS